MLSEKRTFCRLLFVCQFSVLGNFFVFRIGKVFHFGKSEFDCKDTNLSINNHNIKQKITAKLC